MLFQCDQLVCRYLLVFGNINDDSELSLFMEGEFAQMLIQNQTPLATGFGMFTDKVGQEFVSFIVKGTFCLPKPGVTARLAEEQKEVIFANDYFGEPGSSSIRYPAEVVPRKLATDVVFIGHAYAPEERMVQELLASISVGPLRKQILVVGERVWIQGPFGLSASPTKPFQRMPIVYERAYGGFDSTNVDEMRWDLRNPVGTGFCTKEKQAEGMHLPNIEYPSKRIKSWRDRPAVVGCGAVDSHWQPRVGFAGTYDEHWRQNQHPLPAIDFDDRFFNVGAAGLVASGFFVGGERVSLVNLSVERNIDFYLPRVFLELVIHFDDEEKRVRPDLWMIEFEPDSGVFYLIWGHTFTVGKQPSKWTEAEVLLDASEIMIPEVNL